MKPSFKIALCLTVGALCGIPAVTFAQDSSSQPSSSAPAASDSTAPAAPAAPSDQTPPPAHHHGGMSVQKQVGFLKDKLTLTDDEVTKVTAVLQDQQKQMGTLHSDTTLSEDDKKTKMEALRKSTHEQIRALLTPDQQTTFDSLKMGGGHKKADNN